MKILHVTLVRELSSGQRKQLKYEYEASKCLNGVVWDVVALHTGITTEAFEKNIPYFFKPMFLRNIYLWLYLINKKDEYDYLLCRHVTFDPFAIVFGWLIKNRISVHHAKEIQELRLIRKNWKGIFASNLEKLTGAINSHQVAGALSVTRDIQEYQNIIHPVLPGSFIYPNGIDLSNVEVLGDDRHQEKVSIAFVCGHFSPWHGLDLLFKSALESKCYSGEMTIYLIGTLSEEQLESVQTINVENDLFRVTGFLDSKEYVTILKKCDVGLSSFAMHREGLTEGATLKVREYLGQGLPVFSGHKDTALPDGFKFYRNSEANIDEIYSYALNLKRTSREQVRNESVEYIEKRIMMNNVVDWLSSSK